MKFEKLADYFDRLESISSRLEMMQILKELLGELPKEEVKIAVYLSLGKLGPPFMEIETGLGEKYIEEAIAKSSGYSKKEVQKKFKSKGDLGETAEELLKARKQSSLAKEELTVKSVYNKFMRIREIAGKGSQESKIKGLAQLFNSSSPKEAKYIARIPMENMRLGIGEPTIMDGLALLFVKEKLKEKKFTEEIKKEIKVKEEKKEKFQEELERKAREKIREEIESKYNIHSDLGSIAEILKNKGIKGLNEIKITPGIPIRPTLAERLPSSKEIIEKIGKCEVEQKYDGFRIQVSKKGKDITIFSRQSENMTEMFPEIVEACRKHINAKDAIFEGEALAYNEASEEFYPFQITITRKRKYNIEKAAKDMPLKLFAFDVMFIDGKDLMELPFKERKKKLKKIIKKNETINLPESITTDKPEEIDKFFDEALERGAEGIIAKDLNAKYIAGARKYAWIKLKRSYKGELQDSVDAVIIGYFSGRGKRTEFGLGALLTACYDSESDTFKSIAKIGTGLTEQQFIEMHKILSKIKKKEKPPRVISEIEPDYWVLPEYVIEVRADEITKSPLHSCGKKGKEEGYALRFPRMISKREKKPEEATTEKEILKMYKNQKNVKMQD